MGRTGAADPSIVVLERVVIKVRVEERLRALVLENDRVIVVDFCTSDLISQLGTETQWGRDADEPSALRVRGLSERVCWNAGLIKSSPVPLLVRTAKCTQNQKR